MYCYNHLGLHLKPISSRHSIRSWERLRFVSFRCWIWLKVYLILLHHCPNEVFAEYLDGTLQCPNSLLKVSRSWQRCSNVSLNFHLTPISSRRSIWSFVRLYFVDFPCCFWLQAHFTLIHQFPNEGFAEKTRGLLQCPNFHHFPHEGSTEYLRLTLQCPNSSMKSMSSLCRPSKLSVLAAVP